MDKKNYKNLRRILQDILEIFAVFKNFYLLMRRFFAELLTVLRGTMTATVDTFLVRFLGTGTSFPYLG
jgi:hypothetical protein